MEYIAKLNTWQPTAFSSIVSKSKIVNVVNFLVTFLFLGIFGTLFNFNDGAAFNEKTPL